MTKHKQIDQNVSKNKETRGRKSGTIEYPLFTLEKTLKISQIIWNNHAGNPTTLLDLASEIGYSPTSSSFSNLIISSKRYGLTTGSFSNDKTKTISITDLGKSIVAPTSNDNISQLKMKALLQTKIYEKILGNINGKVIPSRNIFENELVRVHHVPDKNKKECCNIILKNIEELQLSKDVNGKKYLDLHSGKSNISHSDNDLGENKNNKDEQEIDDYVDKFPSKENKQTPKQIFVAHGKNREPLNQLKVFLEQFKIPYKIVTDESNQGRPISQKVSDLMHECSSAIFIFTKDEKTKNDNGDDVYRPSDNVVFELGAASVLYGSNIVIFKEKGVSFGSDFKDLGYISFEDNKLDAQTGNLMKELVDSGLLTFGLK